MEVCIVAESCDPMDGGLGRHVYELSKRMGHVVDLTVLCVSGEDIEGVEVVEVSSRLPNVKGYGTVPAMYSFLKENEFDVVHCHGVPGLAGYLAKRSGKDSDFVYTVHGIAYELISREWLKSVAKLVHLPERLCVRSFDKVVAVSENTAREVVEHYSVEEDKITTIYNGVDTEKFRFVKDFDNQLLYVGYFIERKGPEIVLDAFSKLVKDFPDLELVMVGRGRLEEDLKKKTREKGLEDSVKFLKNISDKQLVELYSESIFVMPSAYEGQGIVYVEALSCGAPVIGCNNSAIPEMVEDGENGFLVDRNSEAVDNCIRSILEDDGLRRSMSLNAREKALEFDWDRIVSKTLDLYS